MAFLGIYKAVYDYTPQGDGELDIKEGDVLFVLEKSTEDDWWKAKKKAASDEEDEPEGLIPSNYIEEAHPLYRAKALYDYTKQTDEELSFPEEAQIDVYDISDPDWTLVGLNGEYGFAPAIYIEQQSAAAHSQHAHAAAPEMPTRPQTTAASPEPDEEWANDTPPESPRANPAAALAGIIAQRTGQSSATANPSAIERSLPSPPLPTRPQYTPEEEDEPPTPSLPQRPQSQQFAPPPARSSSYAPAPAPAPAPSRVSEPAGVVASPPYNRAVAFEDDDQALRNPGGFHMYNISEMVSHMGKNKKMPTTLGINIARGIIMIAPAKARDGPSQEWTAEKLTHYSIEGKHVFVELVRPSKSVDLHAGAKDTAHEIVAALGEIAGSYRAEGLREVLAAGANGTGSSGQKTGKMLYEFMAQGDDEVTVAVDDEVFILDDTKSDEWWMVRRLKNGKEGVVPSSYVEVTGSVPLPASSAGLNSARSTVEQNRLEEQRLAKEAVRSSKTDSKASERGKRDSKDKSDKPKPNAARVRTWTDRSGSFKVEAEFIGLKDGKIHLHKQNGVKIAVPVQKMAIEDLEYVERATGVSLDDDKPLSDIKRRSTTSKKEKSQRSDAQAGAKIEQPPGYDWFDFFLAAGCNPQICERYAHAFSRDQMGEEVLPDVDAQLLRTLGLKEGDILRVMKYLDNKFQRNKTVEASGETNGEGGLFSGPGGALRNNTRKGRPAPAVQTNDVVDPDAFKQATEGSPSKSVPADATATPLTSAPAREPTVSGFDDDAWNVKPSKSPVSAAPPAPPAPAAAPAPTPEPPKPEPPKLTPGMSELSLLSPALQPAPAPQAAPQPAAQAPQPPQAPPGADPAFFDKLAQATPLQQQLTGASRQRPMPPMQTGNSLIAPPPARAASAPGFQQQQASGFAPPPLQPQMTGYQAPSGQSLNDIRLQQQFNQQQQQQQAMMPQMTGYSQQQNGMMPQQTGFQPQQQQQQPGFMMSQPTGFQQPGYQQAIQNGSMTESPFADPNPRASFAPQQTGFQPMQPQQTGFGMQPQQTGISALQPQRTGFVPQSAFGQHVTGMNGFGQQQNMPGVPPLPPLPLGFQQTQPTGFGQNTTNQFGSLAPQPTGFQQPQQTGFGSQPMQPLVPQKTGPAPPIRFGVQPAANKLSAQPTGRRANLANATAANPFGF
ncbi:hypothetical protein AAFC00_007318 [Neodothiora populina]|uniref:Actin cytoskeleton-regulatory complex protein SLA1 n=1 Tax=Neodothiora populina TaxID=2781224 RepID=A0ABR3PHV7_9PEZI